MSSAKRTKTVLITGCTPGGIGYALARVFHSKGFLVIATARRAEVIDGLLHDGMVALPLDVTNPGSIKACRDKVTEATGGSLDILINNAGLTNTIPAIDVELDDVRNTFETNIFAVIAMVKAFSGLLISARGRIVNISCIASVAPYVYGSVFCATKGALNSYSRTLRQEMRPFGVKVTVVMAGFVKTKTNKVYRTLPQGSMYTAIEDQFRKRLTYSENKAQMTPDTFADILVRKLLKDKGNIWRGLVRDQDWLWIGGNAALVRSASWVGEWLLDTIAYRAFKLYKLEAALNT